MWKQKGRKLFKKFKQETEAEGGEKVEDEEKLGTEELMLLNCGVGEDS